MFDFLRPKPARKRRAPDRRVGRGIPLVKSLVGRVPRSRVTTGPHPGRWRKKNPTAGRSRAARRRSLFGW